MYIFMNLITQAPIFQSPSIVKNNRKSLLKIPEEKAWQLSLHHSFQFILESCTKTVQKTLISLAICPTAHAHTHTLQTNIVSYLKTYWRNLFICFSFAYRYTSDKEVCMRVAEGWLVSFSSTKGSHSESWSSDRESSTPSSSRAERKERSETRP